MIPIERELAHVLGLTLSLLEDLIVTLHADRDHVYQDRLADLGRRLVILRGDQLPPDLPLTGTSFVEQPTERETSTT